MTNESSDDRPIRAEDLKSVTIGRTNAAATRARRPSGDLRSELEQLVERWRKRVATRDYPLEDPGIVLDSLDALEAALLVLADHERVPLTPDAVLRSKLQSAEQSRDKLRDAYAGLMLRLAKLAEKWMAEGAQAASLGGYSGPVIRDVLRAAVWELREALKP